MKIGSMDRRIIIESKTVTKDPIYNTDVITWVTVCTIWANIQDVMPSRQEKLTDSVLEVRKGQTRLRFRYRAGLDSSMRIRITNPVARTLQIVGGPAEIGGNRQFMEIMAEEFST